MRQRESSNIFEVFSVREKKASIQSQASGDGMTVKKQRKPQKETDWKEAKALGLETGESGLPLMKTVAKKMLKYLEDSEDLKVGLSEYR